MHRDTAHILQTLAATTPSEDDVSSTDDRGESRNTTHNNPGNLPVERASSSWLDAVGLAVLGATLAPTSLTAWPELVDDVTDELLDLVDIGVPVQAVAPTPLKVRTERVDG